MASAQTDRAPKRLRDMTFDALTALDGIEDAGELLARTSTILGQFGFSAFVLSRLPRAPAATGPDILVNGWPEGWSDRYAEAGHYKIDPVASFCLSSRQPFAWTDIPPEHTKGGRSAQIVGEAAEFGLTEGLCVPLHTALGAGGLSLAGSKVEHTPGVSMIASFLAFRVCQAMEDAGLGITTTQRLSARERDVLSWVAIGKTAAEIGMILSISEHTVGEHLKHIRRKLRTSNNAHSIVRALQTGQLAL